MDGAQTRQPARALQLAVVKQDGVWRILLNGEGVGRFEDQADATRCAIDIAAQTRGDGHPVEVLVHTDFGEVRTLSGLSAPPAHSVAA